MITLTLAIGGNTAIFSVININAVMLRTLPVRDPGRLVLLKLRQLILRLLTEVLSPPSCAAANCDGADFSGERFQEFAGGGHEGEVAGIGD